MKKNLLLISVFLLIFLNVNCQPLIKREKVLLTSWEDSSWVNTLNIHYFYDDGFVKEEIKQVWQDSIWVNDTKCLYYYGVLGQDEITVNETDVKVYPNPSNGIFTVVSDDGLFGRVRVFNMSGREVYSSNIKGENSFKIDISSNNPGIYFIKFAGENRVFNNKIVLY